MHVDWSCLTTLMGSASKNFQLLEENNINFVILPANCTDRLQLLDLKFNKAEKMFLHSRFQDWFTKQVAAQKEVRNQLNQ